MKELLSRRKEVTTSPKNQRQHFAKPTGYLFIYPLAQKHLIGCPYSSEM